MRVVIPEGLGTIRLAQQYSAQRMEAAAERAILAHACRYQSVKSMRKKRNPPPEENKQLGFVAQRA